MSKTTQLLLVSIALSLSAGCAYHVPLTLKPTALPRVEKLPLKAALVLDGELQAYKYEFMSSIFPLGSGLTQQARHITESAFREVSIVSSAAEASSKQADVILQLRSDKAEQSMPAAAWQDVNFVMTVQWIARDRSTQNTIWLKPITAKASHPTGTLLSVRDNQQILMQKLFDDFSLQSFKALTESPELKGAAGK